MTNPYSAPNATITDIDEEDETYEPQLFAWEGRIGRLRYLAYYFAIVVLTSLIGGIVAAVLTALVAPGPMMAVLGVIGYVPLLIATFVVTRRRLNDLNHSGWWGVITLVPLLNLVLGLYLVFGPGSKGVNSFGPKPCKNSVAVVLGGLILPIAIIGILAAVAIPAYQGYVMKAKNAAQVQSQ
jgi:uncharacterized membrane protein YhaH (DUF805 family)